MIQLLNRRFINFYYNTDSGPPQPEYQGKDPLAKEFVKGKVKNKYAFYAAFSARGEPLGVTDVYSSKDNVFDFLCALLEQNPEFNRFTSDEEKILASAREQPANAQAQLQAGKLYEELGQYAKARPYYERILAAEKATPAVADASRGLLRMLKYQKKWDALDALCVSLAARPNFAQLQINADVVTEKAHILKARKQYDQLCKSLEDAIKACPQSQRMSEMHFLAGVGYYFLEDKPSAYYHWCWVVENLPDDHLTRRCYLAAAHEGMPYENPELDNYSAPLHGGRIEVIQAAYDRAKEVYLKRAGK
ncbi:MAG: hypothetical protein JNJ77_01320 [Planctomycetia bacterium]|nr:hypothetical protein [Planctomycetia bacterium]